MYPKEKDLKYEEELWPDPEDAPLVPPRNYLRAYLEDHESLPPVLTEQIRGSINCRRALENLSAELLLEDILEEEKPKLDLPSTEEVDELLDECVGIDLNSAVFALPGEIWTTQSFISGLVEGHKINFFNFNPIQILILDSGLVVPCSPEACWPEENRGTGDVIIQPEGYVTMVAHMWLSTKMSFSQLARKVSTVELPSESFTSLDRPVNLDILAKQQIRELEVASVYLSCNLELSIPKCHTLPVSEKRAASSGSVQQDGTEYEFIHENSGAKISFSLQNNGKEFYVMVEKDDLRSDCLDGFLIKANSGGNIEIKGGQGIISLEANKSGFWLEDNSGNETEITPNKS